MKKLLIVLLAGMFCAGAVFASPQEPQSVGEQTFTAASGDTLWTAMERIEGREKFDGHQIINLIQNMNDMDGVDIKPGQEIILPEEVS